VNGLESLVALLSPGAVSTHPGELALRSHDRWALALLREARGDRVPPPAAVVFPNSTDEVARTLAWAQETRTAVVPRGGGTGTVGGAEALKRSIVLDLTRMDRILAIDEVSQTVRAEAGVRGGELEAALAPKRLTTGHYPESIAESTVGGWIASAALGHASTGHGGVGELVLGLTAVLPGGEVLRVGSDPGPGMGPNLRAVLVGSEGVLGVITEATLASFRLPSSYLWEAFRPNSFQTGMGLLREALQRGFRPLVFRLLDEADAESVFAGLGHRGPVLLAGFDAGAAAAEAQALDLRKLARDQGGWPLERGLGEHWWAHRYDGAARYEDVMGPRRALGQGVILDSLGASAVWRHLASVYDLVRGTLLDHAESVACRLSHPYVAGGSLHFTFVLRAEDDERAEQVYVEAWRAAALACAEAGGSLAHHGVGLQKLPFVEAELGGSWVSTLARIKDALDPEGVLNPGKTIPPREGVHAPN
jgi:alkyldihydroxyacetonephosphate synthase